MKNVIVASFTEESKAIAALHKLTELESFGDIAIYEQIMVRKNADGETEILKQDDFEGWRTLAGMSVGSLLGMLGGPVGLLMGLYTGTAVGAIADVSHMDFAEDFIAKVEKKIAIGTVTIIAEIEEDNEVFVDTALKSLGAVISRSDVEMEFDKHLDDEIDEIEAEISEERAALKTAVGEEKKSIQNKIAELQKKRKSKISEFANKGKQMKDTLKSKAASGFAKVKSDIESFGSSINEDMKSEKLERIKRRIGRHQETLDTLNSQLKELQD